MCVYHSYDDDISRTGYETVFCADDVTQYDYNIFLIKKMWLSLCFEKQVVVDEVLCDPVIENISAWLQRICFVYIFVGRIFLLNAVGFVFVKGTCLLSNVL